MTDGPPPAADPPADEPGDRRAARDERRDPGAARGERSENRGTASGDRRVPGAASAPARRARERDPESRPISTRPGDGSLSRLDAVKDERIRRWDVTTPSATLIGRPDRPDDEVGETVRRLHEERHPAMAGHSTRMHRLEKVRIAHALCNACSLSRWERDRVLGIMTDLDLTAFGSQRAIPTVALVVIQYVVDRERRRQLGLHDREWVRERSTDELEALYDRFESMTEDPRFRDLMDAHGLDTTAINRLDRVLQTQLDVQDLHGAAFGRAPHRDPNLPAMSDRGAAEGKA